MHAIQLDHAHPMTMPFDMHCNMLLQIEENRGIRSNFLACFGSSLEYNRKMNLVGELKGNTDTSYAGSRLCVACAVCFRNPEINTY